MYVRALLFLLLFFFILLLLFRYLVLLAHFDALLLALLWIE
jgi:hypothetical protein